MMEASIYLEDGTFLSGEGLGAGTETLGEFVFNTCHTGYEEVLTDPSYAGQVVVFTAAHIGNTGINYEDHESGGMAACAMVCKELCPNPDNQRSKTDLIGFLRDRGKTAIHRVDTRFITQRLRDRGAMRGIVSCLDHDRDSLAKKVSGFPGLAKTNLVAQVSTSKIFSVGPDSGAFRIAVLDFGIKQGILDSLAGMSLSCTVFPWDTPAATILAMNPDGLFLSNGPGDPRYLARSTKVVGEIRKLIDRFPVFGICLGHQLIALALEGTIEKLGFGHHAANHPVKEHIRLGETEDAPVQITSQNHNYAVVEDSIREQCHITHRHMNDGSVAGISHKHLPVFSAQFHPESNPGPRDSRGLFERFHALLEARSCLAKAI